MTQQKDLDLNTATFEEKFDALQALVDSMEQGDVPLAELLTAFKQGQALVNSCRKELEQTELDVQKIINTTGETAPLESTI